MIKQFFLWLTDHHHKDRNHRKLMMADHEDKGTYTCL
jgi:hypothetical protein